MSLPEIYRQYTAFSLMRLFDLTQLTESSVSIETVASSSSACPSGPLAATCICALPRNVKCVRQILAQQQQQLQQPGQQQRVSAALNYPNGTKSAQEVCTEAASALQDGADEFECLIDWKKMNENADEGEQQICALISAVKKVVGPRVVRAVLEVGKLAGGDIISRAGVAALEGGADFLQTSSGLEPDQATFFSVHLLSIVLNEYAKKQARCAAQQNPSIRAPRVVGIKVDIGPNGTQLEATNYLMQIIYEKGIEFIHPSTFRIGGSGKLLKELKDAVAGYIPPDSSK